MEIKYVIDLILVKGYKKGFVFLVAMTLKDTVYYSLKLASKGVSTTAYPI